MSESSKQHKSKAPKTLNFGIYICSTSRYKQIEAGEKDVSDVGGDTAVELLKKAGHKVIFKKIIADDETHDSGRRYVCYGLKRTWMSLSFPAAQA